MRPPLSQWGFFMNKEKKSFVMYCDQYELFRKLPDEIAGKLIKHIYAYVNGDADEIDDLLLQIAFEPIKQQLKRDLEKYKQFVEKQSFNGKKGGRPSKPNESQETQAFSEKPKKADNVNDNVNENENVNVNEKRDKSLMVGGEQIDLNLIFDEVWNFYSKNTSRQVGSKKDAKAKFLRLKSNEIEALRVHLPKFVKNHVEAKKTEFLPNLTTYLNKRSYEDEKLPYPSASNKLEDYLNQMQGL
jgi:hypothetical protein